MSDEIIKFVELVENRECLYNNNLEEYSNKNLTERAWSEIAKEMNWSVVESKEKWRNIRNGFVRSLKPPLSGSSSKTKKRYYLHELMQFVLPYVKPIQRAAKTDNITLSDWDNHHSKEVTTMEYGNESSDVALEAVQSTLAGAGKRRKRMRCSAGNDEVEETVLGFKFNNQKRRETEYDSRKMFLLSLLSDVKSLSDASFRRFKIKSMLLVEELLNKQNEQYILPTDSSS